jgi:hypothetical protein
MLTDLLQLMATAEPQMDNAAITEAEERVRSKKDE